MPLREQSGSTDAKDAPGEGSKSIGGGRTAPGYCPNREQHLVSFEEPHDPVNPQQWNTGKKSVISHSEALRFLTGYSGYA